MTDLPYNGGAFEDVFADAVKPRLLNPFSPTAPAERPVAATQKDVSMPTEPVQRGRAWRRSQQQKPSHQTKPAYRKQNREWRCLEKDWGLMCLRSEKMRRARQLACPYPVRSPLSWAEWFE